MYPFLGMVVFEEAVAVTSPRLGKWGMPA